MAQENKLAIAGLLCDAGKRLIVLREVFIHRLPAPEDGCPRA
jgi:hypothetical protein